MFHITQDSIGIESNICMFQVFVLDSLGEFHIFAPGPARMFQDSRESIQSCHVIYYAVLFASHQWPADYRFLEAQMWQRKGLSGGMKPFQVGGWGGGAWGFLS